MENILQIRINILREYGSKIESLEKKLSDVSITSTDNIFCTGSDSAILYRIETLKKELKKELEFINKNTHTL